MSEQQDKPKVDVYSAGDREMMLRNQALRARLLGPFMRMLLRLGVTANVMTVLSLLCGLAACPLLLYTPAWGLALVALHVGLDGLDGPLAREAGSASSQGSFVDTMADQFVVTAVAATLIVGEHSGVIPGVLYVFSYTLVVAFSMVRNALDIPYSWLVRPRFFVYGWIAVEFWVLPGSLDWVLWLFTSLLLLKVATGFVQIRRKL